MMIQNDKKLNNGLSKNDISRIITYALELKGISARELAKRVDVAQSSMCGYMNELVKTCKDCKDFFPLANKTKDSPDCDGFCMGDVQEFLVHLDTEACSAFKEKE